MLYGYVICVPKNTASSSPYKTDIEIRNDTILSIKLLIPYGHKDVTGFRLKYGPKQLFPVEPSEWIRGDGVVVEASGPIRLAESPATLTCEAYNNSSNYDHCFYLYIDALDWEDYPFGGRLDILINAMYRVEDILSSSLSRAGLYRAPEKIAAPRPAEEITRERETAIEKIRSILGKILGGGRE